MDGYLWSLLIQEIYAFIVSILSLYLAIYLLFRYKHLQKTNDFSTLMIAYFGYVAIYSLTNIIYHGYVFILWRIDPLQVYDGRVLYALGAIPWVFMYTNSAIDFFICLERCFHVLFPMSYNAFYKKWYTWFSFPAIIILLIVVVFLNDLIPKFPTTSTTSCRFFGCFVQFAYYLRTIFMISNLVAAISLALLIKFSIKSNSASVKRMNKTVLLMVTCATMLEVIPFGAALWYNWVTGLQIQGIIGPYAVTGNTTIIMLSVAFYYKASKKLSGGSSVKVAAAGITATTSTKGLVVAVGPK